MTESQLSEHFPGQFWRIPLVQKHSETAAGTLKLDGTCDGFPIKMLQVYFKNSSCRLYYMPSYIVSTADRG